MDEVKNILISWTAKEHIHHERNIDFYWLVGLLTLAFSVIAFIFKDALFGAFIIIAGFLYGYISSKKPQDVNVVISNKDIMFDDEIYVISKIKSFNIMKINNENELLILCDRTFNPVINVHVPDSSINQVKDILLKLLPQDETLVPHIGRRFMARYKI